MNESSSSFHGDLIDKNHIFDLTQNLPGTIIIAKHKFMRIYQIFSCKIEDCFDSFFFIDVYVFKKRLAVLYIMLK